MVAYYYIAGSLAGLLAGFVSHRLAIVQIAKRTEDAQKRGALKKIPMMLTWMIVSALLFAAVIWREKGLVSFKAIEYFIYIPVVMNIAAVDYLIRKIPNELILALLAVKIVFMVIALFKGEPAKQTILMPLIGLAVGFVLFSLPSLLKIPIGAGDIKFSAAIGFCLGFYLFLQAMIIMAIFIAVYLVYLLITRKGNLKTVSAMGPYLSIGVVLTMIFPVSDILIR